MAGVYRPRRPESSPLYQLLEGHFESFRAAYEERFESQYGFWRPVIEQVVYKFLDCGVLEQGFARVQCSGCKAEFLVAFSCKCRYFCPSCHAKRLALWSIWLEEDLLEAVPHRQFVFTLPKRLRAYCLRSRPLLGELAREAAHTTIRFVRTTLDEPELSVGVVLSIQTHGSLVNWNPHFHLLVTDGGFLPDGRFLQLPFHDAQVLAEAFRRAVLKRFVDKGLLGREAAEGMLRWPHSGFEVNDEVAVAEADRAGQLRLARYCARNPVALERLDYERGSATVSYRSDKATGPTAGTYRFDPLEFIARLVAHIPDRGQVMQRYYGHYSNRQRARRRGSAGCAQGPVAVEQPRDLCRRQARLRWAELLQRVFEVPPLECPRCGASMRVLAFIQERAVILKILRHLAQKGRDARAGPWAHGPPQGCPAVA